MKLKSVCKHCSTPIHFIDNVWKHVRNRTVYCDINDPVNLNTAIPTDDEIITILNTDDSSINISKHHIISAFIKIIESQLSLHNSIFPSANITMQEVIDYLISKNKK